MVFALLWAEHLGQKARELPPAEDLWGDSNASGDTAASVYLHHKKTEAKRHFRQEYLSSAFKPGNCFSLCEACWEL